MENLKTFAQDVSQKLQQLAQSIKDSLPNISYEQIMAVLSHPLTIALVTVLIFEAVLYLAFYYNWDLSNMMPHLRKAMSYLTGQKESEDKDAKDNKDSDAQPDGTSEDPSSGGQEIPAHDQENVSTEEIEKK